MTPFDIESAVNRAQSAVQKDQTQMQNVIFSLLCTLLRHEADKEAERNLARSRD